MTPSARVVFAWALLAKAHQAATPIAVTFLVVGWTGSYAISGVVTAALTVGYALSGPLRGRAADRVAASRALTSSGLSYAIGLSVLALLSNALTEEAWPVMVAVALITGWSTPPVTQLARASWPRLVTREDLVRVYTLEASLQEVLWILVPVLAAVTITAFSAAAATVLSGLLAVIGALGFAAALRRAGVDAPIERQQIHTASLLGDRDMLFILWMSLAITCSIMVVDLTLIAWAIEIKKPLLAGLFAGVGRHPPWWAASSPLVGRLDLGSGS